MGRMYWDTVRLSTERKNFAIHEQERAIAKTTESPVVLGTYVRTGRNRGIILLR